MIIGANNTSVGTDLTPAQTDAIALINNKVDKVSGKSLSANDFTSALKSNLDILAANKFLYDIVAAPRNAKALMLSNYNTSAVLIQVLT